MPRDEVNRDDYEWCDGCDAYVPKRLLKAKPRFFRDDPEVRTCPDGHVIATAPTPAPAPVVPPVQS